MTEFKEEKENKNKRTTQKLGIFINQFFNSILVLIMILVLVAGYFLVIRGQYENLVGKRADFNQLKEDLVRLSQQLDTLTKANSQVASFSQEDENLLSLALPTKFDTSSLIIQLKNLADNYGFLINNIKIIESVDKTTGTASKVSSQIKKVKVEMEVSVSDYESWKKFLGGLESSIMIFDVSSLTFAAENPTYKLSLITYYYPSNF